MSDRRVCAYCGKKENRPKGDKEWEPGEDSTCRFCGALMPSEKLPKINWGWIDAYQIVGGCSQ